MRSLSPLLLTCAAAFVVHGAGANVVVAQTAFPRAFGPGYRPLPVENLNPSARGELLSMGPYVRLTYSAKMQLRASTASRYATPSWRPPAPSRRGVLPYFPAPTYQAPVKPFANVRPAPSSFERYWPLLLEPRENPRTGRVIWTLP